MASIMEDRSLFNIEILNVSKDSLKFLKPVTKSNIFETGSSNFDPEGLFSTVIFGELGSKERMSKFGYIDLKLPVLHPTVYTSVISLSTIYKGIAEGNTYAIFSKADNDFIVDDTNNGRTGYSFFIENLPNLRFKDTDSTQRQFKIDLIEKCRGKEYLIDKLLVIPAGLRDYTVNDKGQPSEDEVNDIYRKILTTTNMLHNTSLTDKNVEMLDPIRLRLQKLFVELYEHFVTILNGKRGFIQNKWAKRSITYGTRNVLTPNVPKITSLKDIQSKNRITINHTIVGLYQYAKAITPLTINKVRNMFLNNLLDPNNNYALLVNPSTMQTEYKEIPTKKRDDWLSKEGIVQIMNKLGNETLRMEPVKIDGYYMFLLQDTGDSITIFNHTNDMDPNIDKSTVRPITYAELFYISIYDTIATRYCYNTRYPAIELGSIYPSKVYVKTTVTGRTVKFKYGMHNFTMDEYITIGDKFHESMSVSMTRIARLGADFDGDVLSFNALFSEESNKEIEQYINSKQAYITPDDKIVASMDNDVATQIMKVLTADPETTNFNK